jgi:2-polyprenyl-3-methyl-5-hydroxy-6-metoxy-1,4-benzoquinol methylase
MDVFQVNTDRDWEHLAKTDPFWAVWTMDRYRKGNLTDASRTEFFSSGESYIDSMFRTVRQHVDASFAPRSALDFGCGVGRMLLPLSRRCADVVGVDVSDSMLRLAEECCQSQGATNVRLVRSDDMLSAVTGSFDLVHSFVVLQHIPVPRGLLLLHRLLSLVKDGGVGVLHLTYGSCGTGSAGQQRWRSVVRRLARHFLRGSGLLRRQASESHTMLMGEYPLNEVFRMVYEAGARRLWTEMTNHGGPLGLNLLFRKGAAGAPDPWC